MTHNVRETHCVRWPLRATVPMALMTTVMRWSIVTTVIVLLMLHVKLRPSAVTAKTTTAMA